MSAITTHVLDTARGRPAAGVQVQLDRREAVDSWERLGAGRTDVDGRLLTLMPDGSPLLPGVYRLVFAIGEYFTSQHVDTLYPSIVIVFDVQPGEAHYHVPLLVAPFGYTTYRGS